MVSGGTAERKRVWVDGARAACVVRALAEAQGLAVVDDDARADLAVVEGTDADALGGIARRLPTIVVSPRRLREPERRALLAGGVRAVIDAESSVLDVAFAFSDLLFGSRTMLRRYDRIHGGIPVRVRTLEHVPELRADGRLFDLARRGAFVSTDLAISEGAPIELDLEILGRTLPVKGRVAFVDDLDARGGLTVEFALDAPEFAPKLFALCEAAAAVMAAPRRATDRRASNAT
ncbi:PilZ domain-containing protein [Myxococcota bacterium]|nr:PilZ domain-containing protein [Myxococcota bacterium]